MKKNKLVSVIVPTKNSEATIRACLESIKNQSYKNIEIIVVDNNSTDKTKDIAVKFTDKVFNKGPERSPQRNYGAKMGKGNFLLFIDSDMELGKRVVEECMEKVVSYKVSKANIVLGGIIVPEKSFGTSFWAKCKALERSFYVGVDWIEAARFFEKKTFEEVGGYNEDLISGEDWDLSSRATRIYKVSRIREYIIHNEGDLNFMKILKKKFYYGRMLHNYSKIKNNQKNFNKQSSFVNRFMLYFSNPKKLFRKPIIGIGMLFMKVSEFIFGGIGYLMK